MDNHNALTAPNGATYDMELVNRAEQRAQEIAIVTPAKAPELMATFSRACFDLGRHLAMATLAYEKAKQATANRKAVMIIDIIPEKMSEKKLASNETTRQAFLDLDPEYRAAVEAEGVHKAILVYLKRKIEDMENALNAVKKVYGETDNVYRRANPALSTGSIDPDHVREQNTATGQLKIGKPNY